MKTILISGASSLLLLGSLSAFGDMHADMQQLAEEKQCLSCHARADETPRAPAFSSIAQRYTEEESERLVQVVMSGGEDHWGSATMPETGEKRPEVSEEEARQLVDWILGMHQE